MGSVTTRKTTALQITLNIVWVQKILSCSVYWALEVSQQFQRNICVVKDVGGVAIASISQFLGYGKVFLVRKVSGQDSGRLYAMKVLKKATIVRKRKVMEHTLTERSVMEAIRDFPFLVTLHYAFQTDAKLHLIMGMYHPQPPSSFDSLKPC